MSRYRARNYSRPDDSEVCGIGCDCPHCKPERDALDAADGIALTCLECSRGEDETRQCIYDAQDWRYEWHALQNEQSKRSARTVRQPRARGFGR